MGGADSEWQALTVGAVVGGPGARPGLDEALRAAAVACDATQLGVAGDPEDDAIVNVIFQVSGDLVQTDHVGLRTGRFTKRKGLLVIEVGVPADLPAFDARQFFADALVQAVDLAESHLARNAPGLSVSRARAAAVAAREMMLGPWGNEARPDFPVHD